MNQSTICALASGTNKGGIGVVRISGELSQSIALKILGFKPKARYAHYGAFFDTEQVPIDQGIALFFPKPHSFTGEDVLELQGHGGLVVMHHLLDILVSMGAVLAEPGEFSKRAFLNGKMDLIQVEAVADLIDASSKRASQCALKSLSGEFSKQINRLTKDIIELRVFVEATIDFSEEDIDFLQQAKVMEKMQALQIEIKQILQTAQQGARLREGLNVAIAGKPNAGKSSLLNVLAQDDCAIVTEVAGTTRDLLTQSIHIKGMALNIIDTAGLHDSEDIVEKEGIRRAKNAIVQADVVLLVFDAQEGSADKSLLPESCTAPIVIVKNKIDLLNIEPTRVELGSEVQLSLSAKAKQGIELLKDELASIAGLQTTNEGVVLARTRHILALKSALSSIDNALWQLEASALELIAEDLREAAMHTGSITGEFSSDDLLGEIFSTFCIGK
jgi:tRNA modification GTPase